MQQLVVLLLFFSFLCAKDLNDSLSLGQWSGIFNTGDVLSDSVAVKANGEDAMYTFGGTYPSDIGFPEYTDQVRRYDLVKNTWSTVRTTGDLPGPRKKHKGVLTPNDELIIFGGSYQGILYNEVYSLNLQTKVWKKLWAQNTKQGPTPRTQTPTVLSADSKSIIIFGGQISNGWSNEIWSFDLTRNTWTLIPVNGAAAPEKRSSGTAILTKKNTLLIFAGLKFHGSKGYLGDLWEFNFATGRWTEVSAQGPYPDRRVGHTSTLINDKMYVFGGYDFDGFYHSEISYYDLATNTWTLVVNGQGVTKRFSHTCIVWQNSLVYFGGYNDNSWPGYLNQMAIFSLP